MKIGLFGGTFNPPHITHINIARKAAEQLSLDKLIAVPCGDPPHKRCDADKNERLAMTRIAFDGIADVWDYEISKSGKSYTVETLREVKRINPEAEIYLIIGGDSLKYFDTWYCPKEIASAATLAVANRADSDIVNSADKAQAEYGAKVIMLDVAPDGVSSTEIRLRYTFGMSNADCVPKAVDEYIVRKALYAEYSAMVCKLKTYLTQERFMQTFYVVKRGLELAADEMRDKAFVACLLHDVAKYVSPDRYAEYGFVCPKGMPAPVVHSFLGAKVAERDFGITDTEILQAIKYHTTGRPDMTELEKLVYVADKTEQTRPYPLEHLLSGTLDEMFLKCLAEANEYREQVHGDTDFDLTDKTLEYYGVNN